MSKDEGFKVVSLSTSAEIYQALKKAMQLLPEN
jgi:hypothetical protein